MSRPTRLVAGAVAAGVVLSVGGWAAVGMADRRDPAPRGYRVVELHQGDEAVAIGTPREGLLDVRWRADDGHWSRAARLRVPHSGSWTDVSAVDGASTVAARVSLLGPLDASTGEPSGRGGTAVVACSAGRCAARVVSGGTTAATRPQLTPDGRTAYLGRSAEAYLVWRRGHGLRTSETSGLPRRTSGRSEPLLAPDGSFRVVQGLRADGACGMSLSTSGAEDTRFATAVSFRQPLSSSRPSCGSSLHTTRADSLTVSTVRTAAPVFLAVRDGSWTRVANDPSGLVHLVRRRGTVQGESERVGLRHGRELVIASPDGRRLTVQQRREGDATWTAPRTVARIPQGRLCFDIAPTSTIHDDPFYATVRCRHRPTPSAALVYSYLTIVSDDGSTWRAKAGFDLPLRVGRDMLFTGHPGYRWSQRSGLQRVALPVPEDADYSLLSDGTSVLTRVRDTSGGCTLEVRLAASGATSWSTPVPDTTGGMPPEAACVVPHVQTEGTNAYLHYASTSLMDRLVRRDGWHVEQGPRG